ncbi:hypothetical protein KJ068_20735 [bacterium]|nr:hypothetical protein [bacterium]
MIKPHLFLANAICALLWCSMAPGLAAQDSTQTGKQLTVRKMDIPIEGECIDVVFYPSQSAMELRPKVIIRKHAVEFLSQSGDIRSRFESTAKSENGLYTRVSANGEFLAVQEQIVPAYERGQIGEAQFILFSSDGVLLWQETFETNWDDPPPQYFISSTGIVCKLTWFEGAITFYSPQKMELAKHAILPNASKGIYCTWSPDGRFFAVTSRDPVVRDTYQSQVLMFDQHGNKLWASTLANMESSNPIFSSQAQWIWFRTHKKVPPGYSRGIIYETLSGKKIATVEDDGLIDVTFSHDENLMLGHLNREYTSYIALYELPSGRRLFQKKAGKRLIDFKFFSDSNLVYLIVDNTPRGPRKPPVARNQNAPPKLPSSRPFKLIILDSSGGIKGEADLQFLQGIPKGSAVHPASTATVLRIRTGSTIANLTLELDSTQK